MAETKDPQEHDQIRLKGLNNGDETPLPQLFEVLAIVNKVSIRVKDLESPGNVTMLVHKTRIAEIVRAAPQVEEEPPPDEEVAAGKEETVSDAAVAEKPAAPPQVRAAAPKPKPKAATPAQATKKPAKEKPQPIPFDLKGWVAEHGGIHLSKTGKFDHSDYKLVSHVCFDAKAGFYFTLNTYVYPSGVVSRGKKDVGGNKYPLKGHKFSFQVTNKKGAKEKRQIIGKDTAEQKIAYYEKKGYKKVGGGGHAARSSASQLAAVGASAAN